MCGISDINRSYGSAGKRTIRGCLPSQNCRWPSIVDFGVPVVPEEWMSAHDVVGRVPVRVLRRQLAEAASKACTSAASAMNRGRLLRIGPVGRRQPGGVVGDDADHADVVEVADHDVGAHRVVDHRRDRAERGEREEVHQRLEPLGDHDADRLARAHAVGPVPLGVPVAQRGQVDEAVAASGRPRRDGRCGGCRRTAPSRLGFIASAYSRKLPAPRSGSVMNCCRTTSGAMGLWSLIVISQRWSSAVRGFRRPPGGPSGSRPP